MTDPYFDCYGCTMTISLAEQAGFPDDDYSPTQEDWEWYYEQMHDDYAENVMW